MTHWYYADTPKTRQGPVTTEAVLQLRQAGSIGDDTLMWREGLSGWLPLRDLSQELGAEAPSAQAPAPEPTVATPAAATASDDARWTLAPVELRADSLQNDAAGDAWRPVSEGGAAETPASSPYAPPAAPVAMADAVIQGGDVVLAGFRKRLAAYLIDGVIVGIAGMIVGGLIGGVIGGLMAISGAGGDATILLIQALSNILSLAIGATYYAWFHASQSMATPGKMAVGIKVVRLNGERISIARGVGRYFATILSAIPLLIGFLMAAFTQRKQALHDLVCDTLVVDKWAFTLHPELQRRELGTVTVVVLVIFALLLGLGMLAVLAAVGMAAFA